MKIAGLVLLALLLLGCGASVDAVHAGIARGVIEAQVAFEPVIREARRDAMTAAADRVHGAGGTREEAEAAIELEGRRWLCAIDGHRIFAAAGATYIDALWLEQVGSGAFELATLAPFLRRILDAYRAIASCTTSLGTELPVPSFLDLLQPSWGLVGD
jgi:hypothetical protein